MRRDAQPGSIYRQKFTRRFTAIFCSGFIARYTTVLALDVHESSPVDKRCIYYVDDTEALYVVATNTASGVSGSRTVDVAVNNSAVLYVHIVGRSLIFWLSVRQISPVRATAAASALSLRPYPCATRSRRIWPESRQ